jgi:hypothetical protein
MQAMTLINEDPMGPLVTDEEKYNKMIESRSNRRAVRKLFTYYYFIIYKYIG